MVALCGWDASIREGGSTLSIFTDLKQFDRIACCGKHSVDRQVREKVRESILDMYACMNVYIYRGRIKYVCVYEYVHIDVCI